MPDAIAAAHNDTGDDEVFFALGPIPPTAFLLNLYGIARGTAAVPLYLSHSLTLSDVADAGAHAAGRRLLARSAAIYNTQPGYAIGLIVNATVSWSLPLNIPVVGGAAWIITRAIGAFGLNVWDIILTVTWLNDREYARLYGLAPAVTVIGAPRPEAPPFEPFPPGPPPVTEL